ncbi:glycoside hydrolase family 2 TIM barrel-domain containing protein [Microbacterium sp. ARD32]|uniref:glycoside hydrolase family 2 protein n=1 Tax=Microbacterium sp. ARD32 TaxID=2962577 RepID=UPI002882A6DF|nr:glycoside hydrolase family 2 TIM barrel-domain containing protein [Microbacterium sp. ARD32]MDT0158000.1 glycoside hydrolase family 2 TIM barrel-domain containing protein [Microbacterium sp. ARD32]
MDASLEDAERRRWRASPLFGDRFTDVHAAVIPRRARVVARDVSRDPAPVGDAARETLSLDGEWLLAGSHPGREFSIARWAGDRSEAARREPVGWHREDTDRSAWIAATVPGTVQGALVAAGVIPDPLLDDNTHAELVEHGEPSEWPWFFRRTRVEQQEWWYARRFTVPAHWAGRGIRLAFDGIDYAASVYLNGEPVARHTGMYGGPEVDVTALVRINAENEVVVRIDPPPRDWHGVMKPSPGWGWHYGHLISIGIWRGVRLETVPRIELADPFVTTRELTDTAARVGVQWDVARHDEGDGDLPLRVVVRDPAGVVVARADVEVAARAPLTRHEVELDITSPQPWWPFGYGEQPLYSVEISGAGQSVDAAFGIRTVHMRALAARSGPDTYDWQFVVNGRELFLKGANWCWTDPMARRGFDVDRHILDLVVRANLQMLRAWGGGTVESDEFYEECDRRGILVLQEFPLTFGLDSTGADLATIDEQAGRIVRRLRNHPSLVMWGGGNEQPATITSDDLLTVIGRRAAQYDPSRPFHRTDPWGGSEHFYGVYHEGMPIEAYRDHVPPVFGEYGLSSQCDLPSMHRFLDPALLEQWPPLEHGAILQHQAQFSLFDLFKQARYAHFGPIRDWPTFIEYSQLAQGDALRFASERIRAHSGTDTSAYWFYKVGEAFPGASWAVIDYYGVPKLSYYRAKQFGAPLSAYAVYDRLDWAAGDTFRAGIHVSNDTPAEVPGLRLQVRLYDADLRVIATRAEQTDIGADGRVDAFELAVGLAGVRLDPLVLSVELTAADGAFVSSAWYPFNHQPKSAAVRELEEQPLDSLADRTVAELLAPYADGTSPLRDLPRTRLAARIEGDALVVSNLGPHPAPLVLIDGFPHDVGHVLDDNAFGLAAGATRRVAFDAGGASLEGISVRAWNADAVRPA